MSKATERRLRALEVREVQLRHELQMLYSMSEREYWRHKRQGLESELRMVRIKISQMGSQPIKEQVVEQVNKVRTFAFWKRGAR